MPKGYTDKAKIENYLNVDIDAEQDEEVDRFIEVAETIIDQETNRDFGKAADPADPADRVFDGDGTDTLYIPAVAEIESLKFDADGDPIDPDQYVLYPANASTRTKIKLRYLKFPEGVQNIVVNANWGLAAIPADIEFAATVIAAGIINGAWFKGSEDVQSLTIGRYSVTYRGEQQKSDLVTAQDILDRNKRYTF